MSTYNEIYNALSKQSLFGALPESVLSDVSASFSTQCLEKGKYLFVQGEIANHSYVLLKGRILLETISSDGERLSFAKLSEGSFFGAFALFDDEGRMSSALSITPLTLIKIPKDAVFKIISEQSEFSLRFIKHLITFKQGENSRMETMKLKNLIHKVAHALAREYLQSKPKNNELKMKQTDIAYSLSVSREHVNKALKSLNSRKIIRTESGKITILNIEALQGIYMDELILRKNIPFQAKSVGSY